MVKLATSSEAWGSSSWQYGKYAVKVYTIDGVLIYQDDIGGGNTAKVPKGGVVIQSSPASSMLDAIANPITFYGGSPYTVVNQAGHSGDLYNYYWTSYSRGTDGRYVSGGINEPSWHNAYLDGYIPLRVKSIYDPCPYLYRLPSNGTCNQFINSGWTYGSYLGGVSWNMNTCESWLSGLGRREAWSSGFDNTGIYGYYHSSTVSSQIYAYEIQFSSGKSINFNHDLFRSYGNSVRCIEGSLRSE